MSGYIRREDRLFDPVTGEFVGFVDLAGNEVAIPVLSPSGALIDPRTKSPVSGGGLSGPTATGWSTVWDTAAARDYGSYTITAPLAITSSDASSVLGGYSQATLVADGVNVPTFDGATVPGWVNTA